MGRNLIIAFVGMPGAGKSEATSYLTKKKIPYVRFGEITDEGVKELGLSLTPQNERMFREKIRKELGMAAYAIKSEPKIKKLLETHDVIAIDGLYSWEEYVYLKNRFSNLILIHIYAEPKKRYERLIYRLIRPVPKDKARERDIAELEKLNKGGPIAIADHMIENESENLADLHKKIDDLLVRLEV